jgi:LysM repeat protein
MPLAVTAHGVTSHDLEIKVEFQHFHPPNREFSRIPPTSLCQTNPLRHSRVVKVIPFTASLLAIPMALLALPGCGSSNFGQVAGTGPFDSRGNYIEDWADTPSRWNQGSPTKPSKPSRPDPLPELPRIAAAEQPPPQSVPLPSAASRPPVVVTSAAKPKPQVVTAAKPKPKPQPPKPKPPTTVRHTVKKGDTLSGIAARYGSSVSAIQRANNLRGTLIRIGQTLTVPKR